MKKGYWIFLIFPVSQIMIIVGNYRAGVPFNFLGYAGIICSVIANVALFYILIRGSQKEKIEKETRRIRAQREAERMQMEVFQSQKKTLDSMRKEFEDHLQMIEKDIKNGNVKTADQELTELQKRLEDTRADFYCKNVIVNAVMDEKMKLCRELGAAVDYDLLILEKLEIDPFYLCSIFANLLDNAIEAVSELRKEERFIEVNARMKGNYLFVKMRNATTKAHAEREKREGRGNGTRILQDIARKHEGTYTSEYENGVYTAVMAVRAL